MLDEELLDGGDERVEAPEPHIGLPVHQLDQEISPEEKDRLAHLVSIGQDVFQPLQHCALSAITEETTPPTCAVEEFCVDFSEIVLHDPARCLTGTEQQALPLIKHPESFHLFLHA